ncbi:nucleotidyltransferase domain-containing protein [Candidatus Thiosymbion oneisti]|nr:nucleotidyltransferase domain-containing protein [Candidatus Thiosymbion oneisti]
MHTKLPKNTKVYIFGSWLTSENPSDLDVLVVYDPMHCNPSDAYLRLNPLLRDLVKLTGLRVHPTMLTYSEQEETGFVAEVDAMALESLLELTCASSGRTKGARR